MKYKQLLAGLGLVGLLALSFANFAFAAEIVSPSKSDPNVSIQETHKNLYTAGANVLVNSDTAGDLTVAGGSVILTGKVEQELLMAGGTLDVLGAVGGHARIAGGNVTISAPIGGDLIVAGGTVNISSKSSISGDLMVAGGTVVVNAAVKGNIWVAGGDVIINSTVGGSIYARTSKQLAFGPSAAVAGSIIHRGTAPASVDPSAKVGQIEFTKIAANNYTRQLAGILSLAFLVKLLAWLIAGYLAVKFKKHYILNRLLNGNPLV